MWDIPVITPALGFVMRLCFNIVKNYGFAIILFTIIVRLLMAPLAVKQQKGSLKMVRMKPKIDAINKKYKNNKDKLNQEMMALYQKEHYNPMSGCLPSLIQLPILFGLIGVIYKPLKYILNIPQDVISKILEITGQQANNAYAEINAIEQFANNSGIFADFATQYPDAYEKILNFSGSFKFLGLDLLGVTNPLSEQGSWSSMLWLIPILSGVFAFLTSFMSQKMNVMSASGENPMGGGMKAMLYGMPIFSAWISFTVPAGVGFYWVCSNLVMIAQMLILNKLYNPKKLLAQIEEEEASKPKSKRGKEKLEKERIEQERQERDMSDFDE